MKSRTKPELKPAATSPEPAEVPPQVGDHELRTYRLARYPDRHCFQVTTCDVLMSQAYRVGLTLDELIDEELRDYANGLAWSIDRGMTADEYAAREDDLAVWRDGRLVAAIRPRPGGPPRVVRFDETEGGVR